MSHEDAVLFKRLTGVLADQPRTWRFGFVVVCFFVLVMGKNLDLSFENGI